MLNLADIAENMLNMLKFDLNLWDSSFCFKSLFYGRPVKTILEISAID